MKKHYRVERSLVVLVLFLASCMRMAQPAIPGPTKPSTPATITPTSTATQTRTLPSPTLTETPSPTGTDTPAPTQPPTSTPTLHPVFASVKIAYVDGEQLWIWGGGITTPLNNIGGFATFSISDDGKQIAFANQMQVGIINTDGSNERILIGEADMRTMVSDPEDIVIVRWVRGTPYLLLNTYNIGGPASHPHEDLHIINIDTGQWETIFAKNEGGKIYISPDGRLVAVVSQERLLLMNSDGSQQRIVLTYQPVLYPSDVLHYPRLVWSSDSASLMLEVDSEDAPTDPTAPTTLWRIPVDGSPSIVLQISSYRNLYLSPDFSRFASVRRIEQGNNAQEELHVVNIDGTDDQTYYTSTEGIDFISWSPDGRSFVFWSNYEDSLVLGRTSEGKAYPLDIGNSETGGCVSWWWLDGDYFIALVSKSHDRTYEFWVGKVGEQGYPIINISDPAFYPGVDVAK